MKIVLSIPHLSTIIPECLRGRFCVPLETLKHHIDFGIERITQPLEHQKVMVVVSRFVVDVNRRRDGTRGQGVILLKDWNDKVVQEELSPEERNRLLEEWYDAFHDELAQALQGRNVLLLDCHSMDSKGNVGGGDAGKQRPEIGVVTNKGVTCSMRVRKTMKEAFGQAGFVVAEDRPYDGSKAHIINLARKRGAESVGLEIQKTGTWTRNVLFSTRKRW